MPADPTEGRASPGGDPPKAERGPHQAVGEFCDTLGLLAVAWTPADGRLRVTVLDALGRVAEPSVVESDNPYAADLVSFEAGWLLRTNGRFSRGEVLGCRPRTEGAFPVSVP